MAPRRKRNVVDDSDSEDEKTRRQRKNSLKNYLFPSPTANRVVPVTENGRASSSALPLTPSPVRRSTVASGSPAKPSPSPNGKSMATSFSTRLRARTGNTGKSPLSSPEKKKGAKKSLADEKGKSGDLVALFSKQIEKAQNSPPKPRNENCTATSIGNGSSHSSITTNSNRHNPNAANFDFDDIVSDPISDDDDIAESSTVVSSYVGSRTQKRWRSSRDPSSSAPPPAAVHTVTSSISSTQLPMSSLAGSASQKFRLAGRSSVTTSVTTPSDDRLRPWSERFAPINLDELAVHKKKVADVRRWLEDVLMGRLRQRLLVLKGAAGTGKTTTLQLLAEDLGVDVLEWRNPSSTGGGGLSLGFSSAAVQFDEFLNRGSRFTQLDLDTGSNSESELESLQRTQKASQNGTSDDSPQRRKIMLVEEFPNTFMRSSSGLTSFRSAVLQFLAANTPSLSLFAQRKASGTESITPVVMIVSETLLTTTSASADSFTVHRLLGPEILRHPGTGVIEFNAIAPSLLAKALELVVLKEARKSGRRRTPGPQVLKRLGEVGDIRSAISSLEFLCVKGDMDGDWGARVAFTKGRKGHKDTAMTRGEQETLEMVSQREASLGVFHAVGKVVYNKRDDLPYPPDSTEAAAEALPAYLAQYSRPKRPLVAVDALIDETGTDTHTFISALHENYALSCEQTGPLDPQSSLDYINGCIEYLSESDLLCPTWDIFFGGRGSNRYNFGRDSASHVLRQDEMAFQVAVRGLLFSLPSPVKRSSAGYFHRKGPNSGGGSGGGGGGADQFKMFYPMSLKLWRTKEEVEGFVDVLSSKFLRGEMTSQQHTAATTSTANRALAFLKPSKPAATKTTTTTTTPSQQPQPQSQSSPRATDDAAAAPLLSLGSSARTEMVLERLPYMALIARGKRCSFGSTGMRELEKIVSFHGVGGPATSAEDADDDMEEAAGGAGGTALTAGSSFAADDAWATDKPTDDPSPRKQRRRPVKPTPKPTEDEDVAVLTNGLPIYKLYLSDDDIEEVD